MRDPHLDISNTGFFNKLLTSMIILSVLNDHPNISGYSLIKQIRLLSDDFIQMKAGTVYPILETLASKNLLFQDDDISNRKSRSGTKRKTVYSVTSEGQTALSLLWDDWQSLRGIVDIFRPNKQKIKGESD